MSSLEERERRVKEEERAIANQHYLADQRERAVAKREQKQQHLADQMRPLSFTEILKMVPKHYGQLLKVETRTDHQTTGTIANPIGKLCPAKLKKWVECPSLLRRTYHELQDLMLVAATDPKFTNRNFMEQLAENVNGIPIGSEADFQNFQVQFFEFFMRDLYHGWAELPQVKARFKLKENLSITSCGRTFQEELLTTRPRSELDQGERGEKPVKLFSDRFYYQYDRSVGGDPNGHLCLVEELKPPHKFPRSVWHLGLREIQLDDVMNKNTIPNDPDARGQQKATRDVAIVLTQCYGYMINGGCRYGCVEVGEVAVLLMIKDEDPATLFYHLVDRFGEATTEEPINPWASSLGQRFLLTLLAAEAGHKDQDWIAHYVSTMKTWIDPDEASPPPSPEVRAREPAYRGSTPKAKIENKQHQTRDRTRKRGGMGDYDGPADRRPTSQSPSPSGRDHKKCKIQGTTTGQPPRNPAYYKENTLHLAYCTQKCLKGLCDGMALDESCPNVGLHCPSTQESRFHPFSQAQLLLHVQTQLAESLVHGFTDLGLQGARSFVFKISSVSHGYTFIAKGTSPAFKPYLENEARVYDRLKPIQGDLTPVCLGSIDLVRPWIDLHVSITHMLLLSYGGKMIGYDAMRDKQERDQEQLVVSKLIELGVEHKDISGNNLLRNTETGRLMIIDFERSELGPLPSKRVKDENPPIKDEDSPIKDEDSSAQDENSPVKDENSPDKQAVGEMSGNASPSKQLSQEPSMDCLPTKASPGSQPTLETDQSSLPQ